MWNVVKGRQFSPLKVLRGKSGDCWAMPPVCEVRCQQATAREVTDLARGQLFLSLRATYLCSLLLVMLMLHSTDSLLLLFLFVSPLVDS